MHLIESVALFRDEVEDGLHNDLCAPSPDPSWGLENIWSFHMFPRLASTSRAKFTKFGIVAPAFIRDGIEDRFYGNGHPVYQDANHQAITNTAIYNVDQCLWVWRHIADAI